MSVDLIALALWALNAAMLATILARPVRSAVAVALILVLL